MILVEKTILRFIQRADNWEVCRIADGLAIIEIRRGTNWKYVLDTRCVWAYHLTLDELKEIVEFIESR